MDIYYEKYIKYKHKYLELKNDKYFDSQTKHKYLELKNDNVNQKGGNNFVIYGINRFSTIEYPEMEELLNPIYGCFLKESDFIRNNYFLYKAGIDPGEQRLNNIFELTEDENPFYIINNNLRKKIYYLSNNIPGTPNVDPSNDILYNIKPIDIGRFITILYFMKIHDQLMSYDKGKIKCWFDNGYTAEKTAVEKLQNFIDKIYKIEKIKNNIKLGTKDKMDFHLLLYCLWYILKDDNDINEYYKGIQDVFNITNKYSSNIYNICPVALPDSDSENITFEEAIIKVTSTEFTVYRQERSRSFCDVSESDFKYTYPDCGETTMRNLINLLCFDVKTGIFDLKILEKYNPILELVEYYKIFDDFNKQSSNDKKDIYGQTLTARDAWSYLIIYYANGNLSFNAVCPNNPNHKYNVKASEQTPDGLSINSLQLLNNLLKDVTKWDDLKNSNILRIESRLDDYGIGNISIKHNVLGDTKITYVYGHTWCDGFKSQHDFDISHLDVSKQKMIYILKN